MSDSTDELIRAATSYLHDAIRQIKDPYKAPEQRKISSLWPWKREQYHPGTVEVDLIRAQNMIGQALHLLRVDAVRRPDVSAVFKREVGEK